MTLRRIDELGPDDLVRADEILDRANHDVAKYMAMTARNVDFEAIGPDERAMLVEDLTETDGERAAWDLWAELSAELSALVDDPAIGAVDEAMAALRLSTHGVLAGSGPMGAIARAAVEVADRITALRRSVRARLREVRG